MGVGLNAMIIKGGIEKFSYFLRISQNIRHQKRCSWASQCTQNTKEQEGNSLKGEVGIRGKNQEDIFKQLLQSTSTNIYGAPSSGKKLAWLLWETHRGSRWGPHQSSVGKMRHEGKQRWLTWGSSQDIRQSPTQHCRWEMTTGHRGCKPPARRSLSGLSLGRRRLPGVSCWEQCGWWHHSATWGGNDMNKAAEEGKKSLCLRHGNGLVCLGHTNVPD